MAGWTKICEVSALRVGVWQLVQIEKTPVALILIDAKVYAIDDRCPHRAGPLNEGIRDGLTVICPWHDRKFDLATGKSLSENWTTGLKTFPTKIENEFVWVCT